MPSFDRLANIEKYSLFKARRKEDKRIEELEKKTIALIKQKRIDKEARANEEAHQVMQDLAELSNLSIVDESDVEMEEAWVNVNQMLLQNVCFSADYLIVIM